MINFKSHHIQRIRVTSHNRQKMAFDIQKKLAAILEGYPAIWNSTLGGKNGKGTSNRDAAMHQRKQVTGLLNISEEQVRRTYETLRKTLER